MQAKIHICGTCFFNITQKERILKNKQKEKTLFYEHTFIIHRNYFVHITLHICKKKIAFMRLKLAIVREDQPVSPFTLFMIDKMCESNIACIHYCCGEKYVP